MIERSGRGEVRVLTLAHGKANALDPEVLRALTAALADEARRPARGLIVTGQGAMFSAGLDLLALEHATRDELTALVTALTDALVALFTFPRPTVAAINGHAVAGGALIALACDQRVMAEGKGKIGLTESQLGLVVPPSVLELLRYALPRPVLERLVYGGQLYPTFKALDMQVVDAVVEPEELLDRCVAEIEEWTPNVHAFADIKGRLHAPTLAAVEAARTLDVAFAERWFADDATALRREAIEKLRTPRSA